MMHDIRRSSSLVSCTCDSLSYSYYFNDIVIVIVILLSDTCV